VGGRRAWFDARDYADVGGKLEPLIAAGERFATRDPDIATKLAAERLAELEAAGGGGLPRDRRRSPPWPIRPRHT
jgi:hypothetical protein